MVRSMTASDLPLPPVAVHDLANALIASVKATLDIELDYTSDTLPILDHYVRSEVPKDAEGILQLMAPMAGAYFGEVLRRSFGGLRWHTEGEHSEWRLEGEYVFIHFNPIALALECIVEGEVEGWTGHFQVSGRDQKVLAEALDLGGQIDEEDYYRLAIRYETLEQVLHTLVGLSEQRAKEEHARTHVDDAESAARVPAPPRHARTHVDDAPPAEESDPRGAYLGAEVYAQAAEREPTLN